MECNITVSSRYGSVWCIMSRYNGSVNGYFICDNGRFGYEWLNGPERVKDIFVRSEKGGLMKKAGQESYYSTVRSALEGRKVAGMKPRSLPVLVAAKDIMGHWQKEEEKPPFPGIALLLVAGMELRTGSE